MSLLQEEFGDLSRESGLQTITLVFSLSELSAVRGVPLPIAASAWFRNLVRPDREKVTISPRTQKRNAASNPHAFGYLIRSSQNAMKIQL